MKKIKVLILGRGYVGSNIEDHLRGTDIEYICVSRADLDYSNLSQLNKYIINNNITHVVNCFGFTGRPNVDECESRKEECWELNVTLPLKISNICKSLNINYIHISSGCIFTDYTKDYTEEDKPNFGIFNDSSFYSKSKHAFEMFNDYGCTIRVRMPFCDELNSRSYLTKILKYDNLIDYRNSKTYIPELCEFIEYIIRFDINLNKVGILNFVNPSALTTREVVDVLKNNNMINSKWKFVDINELNIVAPRSNCILSINKLKALFPDFKISTERDALSKALKQ